MKIADAAHLLEGAFINKTNPATWADLGCGKGVFTLALAGLLPEKSMVFAIDKIPQVIPPQTTGSEIRFILGDFEKNKLQLPLLDGILMANSLHFVSDKRKFALRLKEYLAPAGELLIVEYDLSVSNPWVPHPINFEDLKILFFEAGFKKVTKLAERKSVYNRSNIYACLIRE